MKQGDIDFIKILSVVVGIATVVILYLQFREQKQLWDLQKQLAAHDLKEKENN